MQIDELFELAYILIDKKQVTAKEMSARFGVSVRTIYRWVEALSASGIPVYAVQGRGGGIAISEKYALDKTVLTEEERLAIVSSVKALSKLSGSQKAALSANARAVEKISNLT
ncbi:MAG: HTH domain-containing protein, partial [Treponema sp.]|nr:HTH domain-containing protein [Treponema sp.]